MSIRQLHPADIDIRKIEAYNRIHRNTNIHDTEQMSYQYKAPAIQRAAKVVEYIALAEEPVRLSPLASALGLSKSSLHGILHALVEAHWLKKNGRSAYSIHPGLFHCFRPLQQAPDIRRLARPFLEHLAEQTTESVFLGRRNQDKVMILDCVQGPKEMHIGARAGTQIPLLAGAMGKIFLSDLNESRIRNLIAETGLPAFTDNSIQDPEAFVQAVAAAKQHGYALDDEEYLPGVTAAAVPVRQAGEVTAAIWIVGFSSQLTDKALIRARDRLVDAGQILSRILDQQEQSIE